MKKLKAWLKDNRYTVTAFAKAIGTSRATAHQCLRGIPPKRLTILEIYRLTGGHIEPNDCYADELDRIDRELWQRESK